MSYIDGATVVYADKIDRRTGEFLPFIMEVQGGVGGAARKFMIEVDKRKKQRTNELMRESSSIANLDLMTSLSIELQRLNSEISFKDYTEMTLLLLRTSQDSNLQSEKPLDLLGRVSMVTKDGKKGQTRNKQYIANQQTKQKIENSRDCQYYQNQQISRKF